MNFKKIKDHLTAIAETVALASPKVPHQSIGNLEKECSNAFNWVAEEITIEAWKELRKTLRNTQDIQQRWNDRLERNRIKNSVDGLGKEKSGKKL